MIKFRMALLDDGQDIVDLVNLSYRSKAFNGWTSESDLVAGDRINLQQVKDLIKEENSFLFLAFYDDVFIGCVYLQLRDDIACIGMLTTHPKFQNIGIGKELLAFAETYATQKYSIRVFEISVLSVRTELIQFYQRRGYEFFGKEALYPIHANVGRPLSSDLKVSSFIKRI